MIGKARPRPHVGSSPLFKTGRRPILKNWSRRRAWERGWGKILPGQIFFMRKKMHFTLSLTESLFFLRINLCT